MAEMTGPLSLTLFVFASRQHCSIKFFLYWGVPTWFPCLELGGMIEIVAVWIMTGNEGAVRISMEEMEIPMVTMWRERTPLWLEEPSWVKGIRRLNGGNAPPPAFPGPYCREKVMSTFCFSFASPSLHRSLYLFLDI